VARMIMAGNEFMNDVPFHNVYFTGIVRDKLGRKMSKTLGNSPDPLVLIDKYGADAVRLGMLLCSSAGSDILYDESQIEQGRNFCGKIWNSYRLVKGWTVDKTLSQPESSSVAVEWFKNKLNQTIAIVEDHYSKFRISDALMAIYKLFWDEYCAWYLEAIKPAYGAGVDSVTYEATLTFFESLLKMIHPIMPFITEELWQDMAGRKEGDTIMYASSPVAGEYDSKLISDFEVAQETVNGIRGIRQQKSLSPKDTLQVYVDEAFPFDVRCVVEKLSNVKLSCAGYDGAGASFVVGTFKVFAALEGLVNTEEEIAKIRKELEYQQKFLAGVRAKLSNEKFVAHAPENVIAIERQKEADAISRIDGYEAALKALIK